MSARFEIKSERVGNKTSVTVMGIIDEAADLSVGGTECDADWNSLLVRTAAGAELVTAAVAGGVLETRPFPEDRWSLLLEAARGNKRRAREALDALA